MRNDAKPVLMLSKHGKDYWVLIWKFYNAKPDPQMSLFYTALFLSYAKFGVRENRKARVATIF